MEEPVFPRGTKVLYKHKVYTVTHNEEIFTGELLYVLRDEQTMNFCGAYKEDLMALSELDNASVFFYGLLKEE